jgi:4-diphosphocytidyl-2-C-methyl-D-erythritol kinase
MEMTFHPAPGKLNLFLHVVGRRADGYHELQTAFRLVERADRVGIAERADGEIRRLGQVFEDDLCLRAARLLKERARTARGCDIFLEKALPVGGGMGGGSSDAATVLLALNRSWNLGLGRDELAKLGLELGADVPFFIFGENALGEGIGERLSALDLAPAWYLVLQPQVSVSTREIFADSALTPNGKRLKIPPFFPGQGTNDLEPIVCRRFPDVAAQLRWLRERAPGARMTGSGACVFSEFSDEAEARAVQAQLPAGMSGFVTRGLERHPLRDWAR